MKCVRVVSSIALVSFLSTNAGVGLAVSKVPEVQTHSNPSSQTSPSKVAIFTIIRDAIRTGEQINQIRLREERRQAAEKRRQELERRRQELEAARRAATEQQRLEAERRRQYFESLSPEEQQAYLTEQRARRAQSDGAAGLLILMLLAGGMMSGGGETSQPTPEIDPCAGYSTQDEKGLPVWHTCHRR
jgi:multidrug efflux pump subunit AcrA (membrane-fusion protein)